MIRVRYVTLLIIGALVLCAVAQPAAIAKRGGHGNSDSSSGLDKITDSDSRLADYLISLATDHRSDDKEEGKEKESEEDEEEEEDDDRDEQKPIETSTPTPVPSAIPTPTPVPVTPAPEPAPSSTPSTTPAPTAAPKAVTAGHQAASRPPLSVSYLELNPPPLIERIYAHSPGNSSQNASAVKMDTALPGAALIDAVNLPHWKANVSATSGPPRGLDLPTGAIILLFLVCGALVSYTAYSMIWKG